MSNQDIIGLLLVIFIFLIIFVGAFIVVKRRWINIKRTMYGAQFTSQNVYMQFQNLQRKKSIEHVLFQKEDDKEEDGEGDDVSRFLKSIK
jgi:hypothetical protein